MTLPVNNHSSQLQAALNSQTNTQREKIDALSQKQLNAKKVTEEIAGDYPLAAQIITRAAEQCELVGGGIERIEGSHLQAGQAADQIEEQAKLFGALVEQSNPIELIEAISEDLLETCQKLTSRCSELQAKASHLEKAIAHTKKTRLSLLEQLEMLKNDKKEYV